jgi:hypothetical protein
LLAHILGVATTGVFSREVDQVTKTARGDQGSETDYGCTDGAKLQRVNPLSGSSMKQGWQDLRVD